LAEHDDDSVRFVLAGSLIGAGQIVPAIEQHEILLARQPESATLLNNLAWLYSRQGDDRALDYARRAHRIKPAAPEIADTLGWLLVERGELKRGLELLRQANATVPDNPEIGYHLAAALYRDGEDATARRLLKTVLAGAAGFADAADARALLRRLGE
jgi:tetratricopeptide (TPR) repeat protein